MYKGASRFSQKVKSAGRSLTGYPKSRKLKTTDLPASAEFIRGTAYVKKLSPLIRNLIARGFDHLAIAQQLTRRQISTPSGKSWDSTLIGELLAVIKSTQ
jgi:hypothetical protein